MKFKFLALFLLFLVTVWVFGQIPRVDFYNLFILYSILFGLYFILFKWGALIDLTIGQMLLMALLSRLVFVGLPMHSDDFLRFYWDGLLVLHQINPYEYTPKEIMDMGMAPEILKPIYDKLNSPNYYSIYPVTNQLVFTFAAWVGGGSILGFVLGIRFILVICEMVSIWILFHILTQLKKNSTYTLLYALNPLILLEVTGNLHFEGMMITFIFLGLWSLLQRKIKTAGSWIGIAVSIKLTPLILLPLILKYLNYRKFIRLMSALILICGLLFVPIYLSGTLNNYLASIQLYYGTFEFNASIYYLLREVGYLIQGYNMIASLSLGLSLLVLCLICYTAWKANIDHIREFIFFAITVYFIYLIFSMVVHPWYIIPLVGLGVLGGMRFPLVWSYLVILSYYAYGVEPYRESYVLIAIQYSLLAIFALAEYAQYLSPKKQRYYKL